MKWKVAAAAYLSFSRKDRLGILAILLLFLLLFFLPPLVRKIGPVKPGTADTAWVTAVHKLERTEDSGQHMDKKYKTRRFDDQDEPFPSKEYRTEKSHPFPFDPNTLSPEGWAKLGLRDRTIRTITNYLAKGGHFRQPADLQRVYGLHPDEYDRLVPYIRIAADPNRRPQATAAIPDTANKRMARPPYRHIAPVDINAADTSAFIALPGIGSKLAVRIVGFREKLGGFYSVAQVGEVYGLADSVFQRIRPYLQLATGNIRKIHINTATIDELKAHPYIRYVLANPIVAYRVQHGPFPDIEDIRKIMAVTEEMYKKVAPYLEL